MTAVSAHELTKVVICKEFGCDQDRRTRRLSPIAIAVSTDTDPARRNGREPSADGEFARCKSALAEALRKFQAAVQEVAA